MTIATAANMQFAMEAICKEFTQQTGIECQLIVSSSGKLTAQIQAGAPYDLFVSADMKYPETLYQKGFAITTPKTYAKGKLVLWTVLDSLTPDLENLKLPNIKHIALANPKTAPYGKAALEVLQNNHLDTLQYKYVYGESIAQTNQFVQSKAAEIGFTAMSVVLSPNAKNKGVWIEIPTTQYHPIEQGIVLLKKHHVDAQRFYDFVFSNKAKETLKEYGYDI
ncbi:molybdate ABC transporter substrate-binding protein [Wenyingzhuangia sp. 2_MG-2023]|uniref:molybdate ABC transporter substrate-binding protein n=1 Tax=Wenyingzhuangia sp. 2_MG-2023 TaxID=3062639 RepID=UPI0026E3C23E|nr:molybdate ABC transporter substrate-binding protein [Wenyingzhuangia sp. 2_MG-2023]MDO6738535.1 molybdate ABC transporter substrate-binding protein [Wenyingzhuangia sp. 2_MG-2023]